MMFNPSSAMTMSKSDYLDFKDYLKDISGIDLGENKEYLVSTRLKNLFSDSGCKDLSAFTRLVQSTHGKTLRQQVIDMMTTNETFWFRDRYPFDYFSNVVLPTFASSGQKLRVWCAAASSGQEPFSLSILAEEYKKKCPDLKIEIVATDLSRRMLDQAREGQFNRLAMGRGLSEDRIRQHFSVSSDKKHWLLKPNILKNVHFRQQNLLDNFSNLGRFDVIFCRNVLIYFSRPLKTDVLTRMHKNLIGEKILFLGASENLSDATELFSMEHCRPGVYFRGN